MAAFSLSSAAVASDDGDDEDGLPGGGSYRGGDVGADGEGGVGCGLGV